VHMYNGRLKDVDATGAFRNVRDAQPIDSRNSIEEATTDSE
jgi:hypothetical protein